jgi:hypothetical protein
MALMPLLFPHRDAIRFLQERRAESFTASASPGVAGEDAASHGEARRHATENE